ncbi:MAG: AraC family transcriptional regulator [Flavobacteriaceae bacterium]
MKYYLSVFLFFLLGLGLFAQDIEQNISYLTRLDKKQNKTETDIDDMLELCKNIYTLEPDLVLDYLQKLKPVIEQKKYYHGWDNYSFLILDIYRGKGQLQEAEKQINEIYDLYADKFTPEDKISVRLNLALIAAHLDETERSQTIIGELLPIAQTPFQKASLHYFRSGNYKKLGEYKLALSDGLTALDLYKSVNDDKNTAICYDVLGGIYGDIDNYDKALAYAKEGVEWAKKSNNYMSEMSLYNNIGIYFRKLNQVDSTLYYYNKSTELAKKHNRLEDIARNLLNMANVYSQEKQDYVQAEKYYKQSLDICYTSKIPYGIYINWFNLGNNYLSKKDYVRAKTAYDSASVYVVKLKMPSEDIKIQEGYYKLYKEKGDFQKALQHYEKFNEVKQNLNLEQQKKEIAELQGKYDIAVKDREIERINNENMKYRFRNRILFVVVISGIFGAGSLIYFLNYRNRTLRQLYDKNVELVESSILFETSKTAEHPQDNSPLRKVFDQLVDIMENEKLYKEPALTVDYVTQKIQTNKKYLSNSIAFYTQENFNNFVNSYRIKEAKKIILQNPSLSLNEVMYECGFNSRTPFYTAFQKNTGMSPQQFKDLSMSKIKKRAEGDEEI